MDLTGKVVGRSITLGRCLGHGGFGAVYRGFDMAKGQACAVKAIIRTSNIELAVKLEREHRVHSLLSSDPSVVTLHAMHEDATYTYFVMVSSTSTCIYEYGRRV
jgi:serine/threonine protein kinase